MSTSNSPVSKELVEAIRALQATGQLSQILNQTDAIPMPSSGPPMSVWSTMGAMHDGSKRRMTSPTASSVSGYAFVPVEDLTTDPPGKNDNNQEPVLPGSGLPPGVSSLTQWGKTRCDLPKMASYKLSYAALIEKSKTDDVIREYFQWVLDRPNDRSGKVADLHAYLKAVNYQKENEKLTYPNSKEKRVFVDEP